MGDWLGTGTTRQYRSFKEARAFARSLGLKSLSEWRDYCRSGTKPADIPTNAYSVYAKNGWSGWGDWLGTGTIATRLRQYRSFKTARAFARSLGLKSVTEWRSYCKSGKRPPDIPNSPEEIYAETGWSGFGDWLGTGRQRGTSLPHPFSLGTSPSPCRRPVTLRVSLPRNGTGTPFLWCPFGHLLAKIWLRDQQLTIRFAPGP